MQEPVELLGQVLHEDCEPPQPRADGAQVGFGPQHQPATPRAEVLQTCLHARQHGANQQLELRLLQVRQPVTDLLREIRGLVFQVVHQHVRNAHQQFLGAFHLPLVSELPLLLENHGLVSLQRIDLLRRELRLFDEGAEGLLQQSGGQLPQRRRVPAAELRHARDPHPAHPEQLRVAIPRVAPLPAPLVDLQRVVDAAVGAELEEEDELLHEVLHRFFLHQAAQELLHHEAVDVVQADDEVTVLDVVGDEPETPLEHGFEEVLVEPQVALVGVVEELDDAEDGDFDFPVGVGAVEEGVDSAAEGVDERGVPQAREQVDHQKQAVLENLFVREVGHASVKKGDETFDVQLLRAGKLQIVILQQVDDLLIHVNLLFRPFSD